MSSSSNLPTHGTHVYINNRFRIPYTEDSAYEFDIPKFSDLVVDDGYYLAQVKSVYTENYINTIETGKNDLFLMKVNGTVTATVFEKGTYSILTLIASLNTINPAIVWTYDLDERKVTAAIDNTLTVQFVHPDSVLDLGFNRSSQTSYRRFLAMIGWTQIANAQSSYTNVTVEALDPVNLNSTGVLNINLYTSLGILSNSPNNQQTLIQIPNNEGFGAQIFYEPPNPPTLRIEPTTLEHIRIYVTDEWGERVKVPGNTPLYIHMVLFHQTV